MDAVVIVVETDDAETDDDCRRKIDINMTVRGLLTAEAILTPLLRALTVGSDSPSIKAFSCGVARKMENIREATAVGDPRTRTGTIIPAAQHFVQI